MSRLIFKRKVGAQVWHALDAITGAALCGTKPGATYGAWRDESGTHFNCKRCAGHIKRIYGPSK